MRFWKRLWGRKKTDVESLRADQLAVIVKVASHGYEWQGRFVVDADGRTTLSTGGDLSEVQTVELPRASVDVQSAIDWLQCHRYSESSRTAVGRVGYLLVVSPEVRHEICFNRSRTVLSPDPVNVLIDQCARHGPILLDAG